MVNAQYSIAIQGELFDFDKLEINSPHLKFQVKKGDIGVKGRFKDKPWSYGYALFEFKEESHLISFLEMLKMKKIHLSNFGIEDMVFLLLLSYKGQCNWELTKETIELLAILGINFSITCYESDT